MRNKCNGLKTIAHLSTLTTIHIFAEIRSHEGHGKGSDCICLLGLPPPNNPPFQVCVANLQKDRK